MLSIVAVSCTGVALCLIVICVGIACLRRYVYKSITHFLILIFLHLIIIISIIISTYTCTLGYGLHTVSIYWHIKEKVGSSTIQISATYT